MGFHEVENCNARYIYFYHNASELGSLFRMIKESRFTFVTPDTTLGRDINILAGLTLLSGILENVQIHLILLPVLDTQRESVADLFRTISVKVMTQVADVISCS